MEEMKNMENNNEELLLTKDGFEKLENELEHLRNVKRKEIADRIKEAISYGDITDNAEYEDAKNEQAFMEARINDLERTLKKARLLDETDRDSQAVSLGSTVTLKDLESGEELEYIIVGTAEADPTEDKISNESPVGKAIMGKEVGDIVEVKVPAGIAKYEVTRLN